MASSRNLITCLFVRSCKRLNWVELWTGVVPGMLTGMARKFPLCSTSFSVTKAYFLLYFSRLSSSVGIWGRMTAAEMALIHVL